MGFTFSIIAIRFKSENKLIIFEKYLFWLKIRIYLLFNETIVAISSSMSYYALHIYVLAGDSEYALEFAIGTLSAFDR